MVLGCNEAIYFCILYNVFHDFIHVYSPGAGADNALGTKFWCQQQQEHLVTWVICCKFQIKLFENWFYTIFFMIFIHVYSPGEVQTAARGQSFDVNRNVLSLHSFVASFKNMSLKSDFMHFFFHVWYMYIAPGQGQTASMGQNFDVNRKALSL